MGLRIHKLADRSAGQRVVRFDPETGAKKLVNPATPGDAHEPWPLAGVIIEDAPEETRISTRAVETAIREGWLVGENPQPAIRPSGPAHAPWSAPPHAFVHYDRLVFRTVTGNVTYRVVHQPDKYADHGEATFPDRVAAFDGDDETPVTAEIYAAGATRVDHFYGIVREG